MANELNIALTTGRTITARLILDGAYVGTFISCPEAPVSSGHYSGSVPGGTGAGHYSVLFLEGSTLVGTGSLLWDGTAERTALNLPTVAQVEARTLPSADYFVVSDYTPPPSTVTVGGYAAGQSPADLVTGFATPALINDAQTAIISHGDGNWTTATGFLTAAGYTASLPANFGDLSITATTGLVTATDLVGGGLAQETLDAIAAILGHTSYLANAVEARDTDTDISALLTTSAYSASLPANFGALGINASGHIERVTLVDTTTTNTDMRGTDGALTSIGNVTVGGYATGQSPADLVTGYATPANVTDAQTAILTQGNSAWVTADVSGLLTTTGYTASLPANFADLAITATTGLVTTTNPGSGATAEEVWGYTGRTLDGAQATAIADILEDTSSTIPGLIAALPTVAQIEAAGFTTTRHNALISAESAALAVADGRHVINYPNSTATQYNVNGTTRTVFRLYDRNGNLATTPDAAVERRPI